VPFRSEAQRRFMFSQHPAIAQRWAKEFGPQHNLPEKVNPRSDSNESPSPKISRHPRLPGIKRDFSHLHPSQSARFKPASSATPNEAEAHAESGVQHQPGSRTHKMPSVKQRPIRGLEARDVKAAKGA
jgi:hypothetical protein